ncbi:hypothetical protein GGI20_005875, partial [Coemansia sp. BCRC 34301]
MHFTHSQRHGVATQSSSPSPLGARVATADSDDDDGILVMRTTTAVNAGTEIPATPQDTKARASKLLRRMEEGESRRGRSEAGPSSRGGVLGNLLRLHSIASTSQAEKQPSAPASAHMSRNQSWTALPSMLRTFRHAAEPVAEERRFSSGASTPASLRAMSSARMSALMMTPEALAKNGIIPPPSTQSSLRLDEKFSSG